MSRTILLPLLVVITGYGIVGPSPVLAGLLALLALIPHITRKRIIARPFIHIITPSLAFIGCLLTISTLLGDNAASTSQIRPLWAAFGGACLLAMVVRQYFARPLGGDTATLALALLALTSLGDIRDQNLFLVLVVLFLLTAFIARRYGDHSHAPLRSLNWRYLFPLVLSTVIAIGVSHRMSNSIPQLHSWILANIGYGKARTGFSKHMWLGSMRGLLISNDVVMRVHGLPSDYLRGVVYTRYVAGRWSAGRQHEGRYTQLPQNLESLHDTTEIEYLGSNASHYFVPRNISAIAIPSGAALIDRWGAMSSAPMRPANRIRFRPGVSRVIPLAPPEDQDRAVPHHLLKELRPIALEWSKGKESTRDKLLAIERHLQNHFNYSLEFDSDPRRDPIVVFLKDERRGHCEYFASAMALLSRSIGVPARVVGGYRVWERNPISGHYVVRERNAHAWVEAWTKQDGWDHYDPTPAGALARANAGESEILSALFDLGSRMVNDLGRWIDQRTLPEFLMPPVALLLAAFLLQWFRRFRERRGGTPKELSTDEPLPCLVQLSSVLSKHGVRRRPHEPLELLVDRIDNSPLPRPLVEAASSVLRDYNAFRFGNHGDPKAIQAEMTLLREQLTALLRRSTEIEAPPPSTRYS